MYIHSEEFVRFPEILTFPLFHKSGLDVFDQALWGTTKKCVVDIDYGKYYVFSSLAHKKARIWFELTFVPQINKHHRSSKKVLLALASVLSSDAGIHAHKEVDLSPRVVTAQWIQWTSMCFSTRTQAPWLPVLLEFTLGHRRRDAWQQYSGLRDELRQSKFSGPISCLTLAS